MNSLQTELLPVDTLTVVTWNILLDKTRTNNGLIKSQSERAPSLVSTLSKLRDELQTELDVVALQEVHKEESKKRTQHNGEFIAEALGYGKGHWIEHNKKPYPKSKTGRKGEHVGLFGARIDHAEAIELGDNRRAVISHVGDLAVVGIHTRAGIRNGPLRVQQVEEVLTRVSGFKSVAFKGDFNNNLGGIARQAVEDDEFSSVFTLLDREHPGIYPTTRYRDIMYGPAYGLIPNRILDDIYVRGVDVYDAGAFLGDSDHPGLWAKIGVPSPAILAA